MKKFGNFNIAALVIGFSFLYIPIILLILFSFNESRLVTVWGGFSTKWYGELMQNQGIKAVSYTHLRAHETDSYLVCRLLLEKKK